MDKNTYYNLTSNKKNYHVFRIDFMSLCFKVYYVNQSTNNDKLLFIDDTQFTMEHYDLIKIFEYFDDKIRNNEDYIISKMNGMLKDKGHIKRIE